MSKHEDRPFDRSTADRIIQRALELDAQRADALSESQLREIAAEMSLSPLALDQALAEHRARSGTGDRVAVAARTSPVSWYWKAGASFSLLLALAMISRLFPGL